MTFHKSTVEKLRLALVGHEDKLEAARGNVVRRRQALADAQEELGYAEEKEAVLIANVADCKRWLDFAELCDHDTDLAYAFANAVLNRDAEMQAACDEATATDEAENAARLANVVEGLRAFEAYRADNAEQQDAKDGDDWDSNCNCSLCRARRARDAESEA